MKIVLPALFCELDASREDAKENTMHARFTEEDESFRTEIAAWLEEHLTGDFEVIRGRGGPGDDHALFEERQAWDTFDLCREILGYGETRCRRSEISVYELDEDRHGRFDVIFFFGTLYHLRYPLLALDRLASICDGEIYVESAIIDDFSPYRGGFGKGYPEQMVMEFYPQNQYGNNQTNWWAPSLTCLVNMLKAAGFNNCRGWKLLPNPKDLACCRGFAYGQIEKKELAIDLNYQ